MSILSKATGIHISPTRSYVDRNQLGNALKNISPIAGAFTGGLGGMLLGGLGSAAGRGVQKGANLGNILGQGVSGAGMASLGESALGGLKSAFGGGGALPVGGAPGGAQSVAPTGPSPAAWQNAVDTTSNIPGPLTGGGGAGGGIGDSFAPKFTAQAGPYTGAIQGAGPQNTGMMGVPTGASPASAAPKSFLSRAGSFIENHPTAISGALQGIGGMAQADSSNRLRNAQAATAEEDLAERKRREIALEPLRRALAGQFSGMSMNNYPMAKNPYAP